MDHTQFLGNTLELIAREKGGIIKPNIPVVIGETQKETKSIFMSLAKQNDSKISFADKEVRQSFSCDLKGNYQKKNINTAVQTINILNKKGFEISSNDIEKPLVFHWPPHNYPCKNLYPTTQNWSFFW